MCKRVTVPRCSANGLSERPSLPEREGSWCFRGFREASGCTGGEDELAERERDGSLRIVTRESAGREVEGIFLLVLRCDVADGGCVYRKDASSSRTVLYVARFVKCWCRFTL